MRAIDISGKTYGMLTAIRRGEKKGYWVFRCECGNEKEISAGNITAGRQSTCGCRGVGLGLNMDLTGQRFGRLVALEKIHSSPSSRWKCRCDCGNDTEVSRSHLLRGNIVSCGCYHAEVCRDRLLKHGHTANGRQSLMYRRWGAMKARCENENNHKYKDYGARGITVCDRWQSFESFYADMGAPPPGTSLDRIDNDGPYSPDNCRWATALEQRANQRRNKDKRDQ